MSVVYHYTTGSALLPILEQRALTPVPIEPGNITEIPSIMFSTDPIWERTRFRTGRMPDGNIVVLTHELLTKYCGGTFRVAVSKELAPLDWKGMKDALRLSYKTIQDLYDLHVSMGARTSEWFASTQGIPVEEWISIEGWKDGAWSPLSDDLQPQEDLITDFDEHLKLGKGTLESIL